MSEEHQKDGAEREWGSGPDETAPPPPSSVSSGSSSGSDGELLIKWTDDLSVGNPLLDGQHKRLISMINTLGRKELSVDELGEVIFGLLEYAAVHFRDEEAYFKDVAPEIIPEHFESHTAFISTAYRFVNRFKRGEALALRDPVYEFLCDWLIHHIRDEDSQYNKKRPGE